MAQHRGGGGGGGSRGSVGGGFSHAGGGFSSVGHGGFVGGGIGSSGFRGGVVSNGFRGGIGFRNGFGFNRGIGFRGFYGGYGWPYYGYGFGLGYGYGYGYSPYYDGYYGDPYSYYPDSSYSAQAYQSSPNVTVVYPQSQPMAPAYADRATPVMREYDQYGQQLRPEGSSNESSSPIYLIAMKNHNIYAAASYSVNGDTLHYVTLEHAEKQIPLDSVDRDLTLRLNRERHIAFQLPSQQ